MKEDQQQSGSGFGRNFARDVEAILAVVQIGEALETVYIYPHEVRENLRRAGVVLDRKLEMSDFPDPFNPPEDHEPDWSDPVVSDEETVDA